MAIITPKKKREYDRKYYLKHKVVIDAYRRKWRKENVERVKALKTAWYLKNKNTEIYREKKRLKRAEWVRKNPEKAYHQYKKSYDKRRKENPNVAIALRLRNHIRK